ncbi:50S ribosomal subunit protein L23 [Hyella patelloides LEGE 07179]|uniref:Large ribosomal subunit protein uL23 n=1 Tax=Hyella patelloides LEGE 07179 TaxID=945734 RepID=A0A563VYW3_9CYAN|nr:50S ribosomal protein L23 [Hyella patelloides]VEP16453.1 50S ribosomal subunit protein L23 [Hyella patelloides LEGE 07179]
MKEYNPRDLADLILKPIITEKATLQMEENKYVFDVLPKATKPEIRAAIESLFDVKVTSVNTLKLPRKKKRVGRYLGYKAQYKRAIVTLQEGDSIALFPEL